jgi:hypothetical protein
MNFIQIKENHDFPISIIVPHIESRKDFFVNKVLPSLEKQKVKEIIILEGEESAPRKRNKGAEISEEKYLFFCDDDIILPENHLKILYESLKSTHFKFAYTDYEGVLLNSKAHPIGKNFYHKAVEFDKNLLLKKNYISTMSLVESSIFPGFDESLPILQDWDLWLNISSNNYKGYYCKDTRFIAHYLDEGITKKHHNRYFEIKKKIKEKYNK